MRVVTLATVLLASLFTPSAGGAPAGTASEEGSRIELSGQARADLPRLEVDGTRGNDTLVLDFSDGNPVPGGLVFDGGAETGPPG